MKQFSIEEIPTSAPFFGDDQMVETIATDDYARCIEHLNEAAQNNMNLRKHPVVSVLSSLVSVCERAFGNSPRKVGHELHFTLAAAALKQMCEWAEKDLQNGNIVDALAKNTEILKYNDTYFNFRAITDHCVRFGKEIGQTSHLKSPSP